MPRKQQLVCEHLENISRDALERYQSIIRDYVRNRQGIYALYRRNKLYYVGLATNLRARLGHHLKDRHGDSWDRFSVYITIGDSHIKELESLILRIIKPSGNRTKGKFVKSQDLRRRFAADIRAGQRLEIDALLGDLPHRTARPSRSAGPVGSDTHAVLAKFIRGPMVLSARHKGHRLTARVRRDGTIRFDGKVYTSPSLAGAAAVKRCSCNGWTFWKFERAPGDWVLLDQLRK